MSDWSPIARSRRVVSASLTVAFSMALAATATAADSPAMKNFVGVNGHTVNFDEQLMRPTTSLVRDYHNFAWDLGSDTSADDTFPWARVGGGRWINWNSLYGSWTAQGHRVNAAIQFSGIAATDWTNPAADAFKYGAAFAQAFGAPGSGVVDSIQIGNENGFYTDSFYRTILQGMTAGVRSVDPTMTVVTANMTAGVRSDYANTLSGVFTSSLTARPDVIAVHSYPHINGYPYWETTYPEDPRSPLFSRVQSVIDWRDANAPTTAIWVTEFGYDATTKPNFTTGTFKDWRGGVTDTQQAQYLTRAWLTFSSMDVERAYMYFHNDSDTPSLHASAGLTRNFVPKPSYWATSQLQDVLGDYHFFKIIQQDTGLYVYSFKHETDLSQTIYVAWSPTGDDTEFMTTLTGLDGTPVRGERMKLANGAAPTIALSNLTINSASFLVNESPAYLFLYRLPGDANLDGRVDVADLGILAANFRTTLDEGADEGDFDYDGVVSVADLGILAANFRTGVASFMAEGLRLGLPKSALNAAVPEPASLALLAVAGLAVRRRR